MGLSLPFAGCGFNFEELVEPVTFGDEAPRDHVDRQHGGDRDDHSGHGGHGGLGDAGCRGTGIVRAGGRDGIEDLQHAEYGAQQTEQRAEHDQGPGQADIALQARLEALSAANLLSDDERDAIEDIIADASSDGSNTGDSEDVVFEILALSGKMVADRAFARQLRRRHT